MLAGDVWRDDAGKTQVRISKLPENPIAQRSIGSAVWMYLCKAYFHSDHVNRLQWVEKGPEGVVAHQDGVADKVAAAKSVLLVIHGIIGDSKPMAESVLAKGIAEHFDLVLSYDYENLSTSIEDTAKALQDDLTRAGLNAGDGKTLVILAHSMGGLVARWFVEKEGGAAVVDRLVLCGTPNEGSPFGKIETARQVLTLLATVAMNFPALTPVCGPALTVLTLSKKLTPTLEEMAPHSTFITTMFGDGDAGVPITILAGDIDKYQDPNPKFFDELLLKLGRGAAFDALFDHSANDLAVEVGSIRASNTPALAKANRINVACHHLNYFQCDAGIAALKSLDWTVAEKAAA
jgi:pimeloyl-ACP methyl ester carboxylesterase